MLEGAFLHLKGIGRKKRDILYQKGIIDWETALKYCDTLPLGNKSKSEFLKEIKKNIEAMHSGDIKFFVDSFHTEDKWRILAFFFTRASFFDIETDGFNNRITTISVYHKNKLYNFTRNKNLDDFLDILEDVDMMVSFNGTSFDVPVVVQNFRIPQFPVPHLDLRWICYHEGIRGGLKEIESKLNIKRPIDLYGVNGWEAVNLWIRYVEWGDGDALKKLIRYCSADVLSLVKLSEKILSNKIKSFIWTDDGEIWNLLNEH